MAVRHMGYATRMSAWSANHTPWYPAASTIATTSSSRAFPSLNRVCTCGATATCCHPSPITFGLSRKSNPFYPTPTLPKKNPEKPEKTP